MLEVFDENVLRNMVMDLKIVESSDNFEEMLKGIKEDNRLYGELVRVSKKFAKINNDVERVALLVDFRAWFIRNMELDILGYLRRTI